MKISNKQKIIVGLLIVGFSMFMVTPVFAQEVKLMGEMVHELEEIAHELEHIEELLQIVAFSSIGIFLVLLGKLVLSIMKYRKLK